MIQANVTIRDRCRWTSDVRWRPPHGMAKSFSGGDAPQNGEQHQNLSPRRSRPSAIGRSACQRVSDNLRAFLLRSYEDICKQKSLETQGAGGYECPICKSLSCRAG